MPTFNFTIETKPERKPKSNINKTVKLTKVEGIVNITIDGIYKVKVNKFIYDIHKDCYSCKGITNIYKQELDKHLQRILYVRDVGYCEECNPLHYLPFTVGCNVIGDIISINDKEYFCIKKVFLDFSNNEAHNALEFYKNNYKVINQSRINRILNEELNE